MILLQESFDLFSRMWHPLNDNISKKFMLVPHLIFIIEHTTMIYNYLQQHLYSFQKQQTQSSSEHKMI